MKDIVLNIKNFLIKALNEIESFIEEPNYCKNCGKEMVKNGKGRKSEQKYRCLSCNTRKYTHKTLKEERKSC